jgi:hypothetical protein
VHVAGRTNRTLSFSFARKLKLIGAIDAEDMANASSVRDSKAGQQGRAAREEYNLQVVTTA